MYVKARKGFIKMAIQEGATLVPTYCFGHTQLHDVSHGPGSLAMTLSRRLRVSLLLFMGQYGLPIPHRFPLVMCVGSPMAVTKIENPTPQEIDEGTALTALCVHVCACVRARVSERLRLF